VEKASFFSNRPILLGWRKTSISKEIHVSGKDEHWEHCLCEWTHFLRRILPENQGFQGGGILNFLQIGQLSWVGETHVSLARIPSVWEAAASSTLFPCEIWVSFSMNTSLKS
jgi:hypothetical protein